MYIDIAIVLLISLACLGISIFSITGSTQVHDRSILKNMGYWWQATLFSSGNKWKDFDKKNGERFPFSSTLLVAFTDAWHAGVLTSIIGMAGAGVLTGMQATDGFTVEFIYKYALLWSVTYGLVFNGIYHYWLLDDPIPTWQWIAVMLYMLIAGSLGLQFGILDSGILIVLGFAPITGLAAIRFIAMLYGLIKKLYAKL